MKIIMTILLIVGISIAIPLIVALFVKNEYTVKRELDINKPKEEVYNYVKYSKNQDYYSKWVMTDPAMKKEFRGTDGTIGFIYAWDGNDKAGKGEQEIKNLTEGEKIEMEIRFEKPFKGIAHTRMSTEGVGKNQTKIVWSMEGRNNYPMNLMNLFVGNLLGKDIDISLRTLKGILEKQ
jgi:hypothetical protein